MDRKRRNRNDDADPFTFSELLEEVSDIQEGLQKKRPLFFDDNQDNLVDDRDDDLVDDQDLVDSGDDTSGWFTPNERKRSSSDESDDTPDSLRGDSLHVFTSPKKPDIYDEDDNDWRGQRQQRLYEMGEVLKLDCKNMNDPLTGDLLVGYPVFMMEDVTGKKLCFNLYNLYAKLQDTSRLQKLDIYFGGTQYTFDWTKYIDAIEEKYRALYPKTPAHQPETCVNGDILDFRDPITEKVSTKRGIILKSLNNSGNYCFDSDTLVLYLKEMHLHDEPIRTLEIKIHDRWHSFDIPKFYQDIVTN